MKNKGSGKVNKYSLIGINVSGSYVQWISNFGLIDQNKEREYAMLIAENRANLVKRLFGVPYISKLFLEHFNKIRTSIILAKSLFELSKYVNEETEMEMKASDVSEVEDTDIIADVDSNEKLFDSSTLPAEKQYTTKQKRGKKNIFNNINHIIDTRIKCHVMEISRLLLAIEKTRSQAIRAQLCEKLGGVYMNLYLSDYIIKYMYDIFIARYSELDKCNCRPKVSYTKKPIKDISDDVKPITNVMSRLKLKPRDTAVPSDDNTINHDEYKPCSYSKSSKTKKLRAKTKKCSSIDSSSVQVPQCPVCTDWSAWGMDANEYVVLYKEIIDYYLNMLHAADGLVVFNLRLVISISKRFTSRRVHFLDVVQEGNLGLIKSSRKFDYSKGNRFSTYTNWWVQQNITRQAYDIYNAYHIPIHIKEILAKLFKGSNVISDNLSYNDRINALTKITDIEPKKIKKAIKIKRGCINLNKSGNEICDEDSEESPDSRFSHSPYRMLVVNDKRRIIERQVSKLSPKDRHLFILRHLSGSKSKDMTLEILGYREGRTRERIRQRLNEALSIIRGDPSNSKYLCLLDELT